MSVEICRLDELSDPGARGFAVGRGDRVAQLVVAPVTAITFSEMETLDDTERGTGGHGSTGR